MSSEHLPGALLDYQLDAQHGDNRRYVTHIVQDPDLPPSAPPRVEVWKTGKRPVGRGGQGQVFKQTCISGARHINSRALKVIECRDNAGKRRYIRELETMIKFSHEKYSKFFVRMLGWYFLEHDVCIAMEYLSRGDLQSYMHENPSIPEPEIQQIISQVLQGLAIMHKGGFAHRDIKPQNVLIQQHPTPDNPVSWWVKLADFGISKQTDATFTVAGGPVGTLEFMAPELLDFTDESSVDYRAADIWAVGAMSFYVLTRLHGFRRRRSEFKNLDDAVIFLASNYDISSDGIDFLLNTTMHHPSERLLSRDITSHAWVDSFIPKLSIAPSISNYDSSAPSSPSTTGSLFSSEQEIQTLATNLTETYLNPRPETLTETYLTNRSEGSKRESLMRRPATRHTTSATSTHSTPVQNTALQNPPVLETSVQDTPVQHPPGQMSPVVPLARQNTIAPTLPPRKPSSQSMATQIRVWDEPPPAPVEDRSSNEWPSAAPTIPSAAPTIPSTTPTIPSVAPTIPISTSARLGNYEVVQYYVSQGADVNAVGPEGYTPLFGAAMYGHKDMVQLLCNAGADIGAQHVSTAYTPLHAAAREGHAEIVAMLADRGADINTPNSEGWIALETTIAQQHIDVLQVLVNRGAAKTQFFVQCLIVERVSAHVTGNLAIATLLVNGGADITTPDDAGWTAVNVAARNGHLEIVRLLVDRGVDFSAPNNEGWTPLNAAASLGHTEVVRLLASKGADVTLQNTAGLKPVQTAGLNGHVETMKLLNSHQTKAWLHSPDFKPISIQCEPAAYTPIPAFLTNYSQWTSTRGDLIGHNLNHKLFARTSWFGITGSGPDRSCWVIHNGGTKKHPVLAAGGEIAKGTHAYSLDSIINIAALPGTTEALRGAPDTIVLRAGLSEADNDTVIYRFSVRQAFQNGAVSSLFFEWRRIPKNPAMDSGYHKEMHLYQIQQPGSDWLQDPNSPDMGPVVFVDGGPLTTFLLTGRLGQSETWSLNMHRHLMGDRTALAVLCTAISIREFILGGPGSKQTIKNLIGHGNHQTFAEGENQQT